MTKSVSRVSIGFVSLLAISLTACMNSTHDVDYLVNRGKKLPSGKVCRVVLDQDHMHAGNGADPSKSVARAEAKRGWSRFVIFEYGRLYGKWSAADKKSMRCIHDKDGGVWRCRADAQPCQG